MRNRVALVVAGLMVLLSARSSEATGISFDLTFDPQDVLFDNKGGHCTGDTSLQSVTGSLDGRCSSLAYSYILSGFDPSTDTLTMGGISFAFYDDGSDPGSAAESVIVSLAGLLTGSDVTITNGSGAGDPFTASFDVQASLQVGGILSVLLTLGEHNTGNNDFYFASSRLAAAGERLQASVPDVPPSVFDRIAQVPEPGTLALLGLLAGAVTTARRRRTLLTATGR